MLENCQRHHMLLGLGALTIVTILVLIVESRYAADGPRRNREQQFIIENNSTCWRHEKYTVVQECHPCSDFDIVSRSLGVCIHTHYKELLRCQSGEIVTKSCDRVALIEQRNFVKFEALCLVVGVLAYLVSYARDRVLSRRNYMRIERQLNRVQ
ncbi:protein JTB [Drosophila serrata]|uniref:protein JTB n=1 Tax=Drosophila serrata TaxID=7274 RepID=UPI000A1CF4E6|nr:protein JTB [Drosophila serrata]XP_020799984.1 protein JTB [Drosophila serrata]